MPAHRGEEVTDEALDGPHARIIIHAEKRLHVQKAIVRVALILPQSKPAATLATLEILSA